MKITILNTRQAVGTTALVLGVARALADIGQRTLVVDLNPNTGATSTLGLPSSSALHDFLLRDMDLNKCRTSVRTNLDVLCSGPATLVVEKRLQREPSAHLVFEYAFSDTVSEDYDFILFDPGAGLSLLQVASLCYSRRILIPVTSDVLGMLGALSAYISAQAIRSIYGIEVDVIGYVPVTVNGDKNERAVTAKTISSIARDCGLSVLPAIEYDESVQLASRNRTFVADFFAGSLAAQSYSGLAGMLVDSVSART